MGYNYYYKNTGLDDCTIVVVVMVVIDCQDATSIVIGYMGKSLPSVHRDPRKGLFFILSRMGQEEDTNIIKENIFNYKIQFSHLLFIGLFKQKVWDKVYRVTRNVFLGAQPLLVK